MISEADIQRAIVRYVGAVAPNVLLWAVPNAARRSVGGRASNGVPGLRKGVFDLSLLLPDGRFAAIEVKRADGRVSPEQQDFKFELIKRGVPYCIAKSVDDVRAFFATIGVETREAN